MRQQQKKNDEFISRHFPINSKLYSSTLLFDNKSHCFRHLCQLNQTGMFSFERDTFLRNVIMWFAALLPIKRAQHLFDLV